MPKVRTAIFFLISVLSVSAVAQDRFERYPKVQGYEVRPGVLVTPRYTAHGQLYEIGVERLGYSSEGVRVDLITSEEIESIVDELVPAAERGNPARDFPPGLISVDGLSGSSKKVFENVSIQIYFAVPDPLKKKNKDTTSTDLVGIVRWRNRTCK